MTAETDIAAIDDGGANTAAEVRTALTSVLARGASDGGFTTLTDTASITGGADSWNQWGTEEVRLTAFAGEAVIVHAVLTGGVKDLDGSTNGRRVRVQISLDDGSTWTQGAEPIMRNGDANASHRYPIGANFARAGTVTTAVQVRAQLFEFTTTKSTFENGGLSVMVGLT